MRMFEDLTVMSEQVSLRVHNRWTHADVNWRLCSGHTSREQSHHSLSHLLFMVSTRSPQQVYYLLAQHLTYLTKHGPKSY